MGKRPKHTEEAKAKISNSMMGKKNAEKYTEIVVIELLQDMLDLLSEDMQISVKKVETNSHGTKGTEEKESISYTKRKIHLKEHLLIHFKIWNVHFFSEMKAKFIDNQSISASLNAIDMVCSVNTYNDAANGVTSSIMAKMHLSTNYGWSDNTKASVEVKTEGLTDKELEEKIAEFEKRNK